MQEEGDHTDDDQKTARQEERREITTYTGFAHDVLGNERDRLQRIANRRERTADHQKDRQQNVRGPCQNERDFLRGQFIELDLDGADPACRPLRSGREIPALLRHQETGSCGKRRQRKPDETAGHGREFSTEENRAQHIRNGEREGRKQREGQNGKTFRPRAVAPEEAGHDDHEEQRHERAADGVQDSHFRCDDMEELFPARSGALQLRRQRLAIET